MSKYTATVIKSGNSYALRIPKPLVDEAQLKVGQKVQIDKPVVTRKQNREAIQEAIRNLQALNGAFKNIKDPVAWQREIRKDRPLPGRD